MVRTEAERKIATLRQFAHHLPMRHPDLHDEFDVLFDRSLDDPAMALGRARRLMEVLVARAYVASKNLNPPLQSQLKKIKLYGIIRSLVQQRRVSQTIAASCHAVRLAGNRVLHYQPDTLSDGIGVSVTSQGLLEVLQDLVEVAESLSTNCQTAYIESLDEPFASMYRKFRRTWR